MGKVGKFFTRQAHLPYVGPIALWALLLVIAPIGFIIYLSFQTTGPFGEIIYTFNLENYQKAMTGAYAIIFLRSILYDN